MITALRQQKALEYLNLTLKATEIKNKEVLRDVLISLNNENKALTLIVNGQKYKKSFSKDDV